MLIIRFDSRYENQPTDLTVAEVGVLLTAVNRSINAIVASSNELKIAPEYFARATTFHEPDLVQLTIRDAKHGSFEVQAAIDLLNAIGLDHDTAKNILLGIVASALWDQEKTKRIARDFQRAIARIARGAKRKTIRLTISVRNRFKSLSATVDESGRVQVTVDENGIVYELVEEDKPTRDLPNSDA